MEVPEVKEPHEWCKWARPGTSGGGCAIYRDRPQGCRSFHCQWLADAHLPDYWYPLKSKIVISTKVRLDGGRAGVAFIVDPAYPNRWREEPFFSDIKKIARSGIDGSLGAKWLTVVKIGEDEIPIIAGKESELAQLETMFARYDVFSKAGAASTVGASHDVAQDEVDDEAS